MMKLVFLFKYLILPPHERDGGFTLLGFLTRIVIYSSVIDTLLMPTYYGNKQQSRNLDPKTHLERMGDAQEAYYQKNGVFAERLNQLENSKIQQESNNYTFRLVSEMNPVSTLNDGELKSSADLDRKMIVAQAKKSYQESYIAIVFSVHGDPKTLVCSTPTKAIANTLLTLTSNPNQCPN